MSASEETGLIRSVLERLGATPAEAKVLADIYTEADLRGLHSHGIQRLPVLVERIQKGLIVPGGNPELSWLAPSVLRVQGRRGLGPYVAFRALEALEPAAKRHGIALATIADSSHSAMTGHYCEHYARKGWILISLTTSEVLVHPAGGAEALVGSNPIAIGVPLEPEPFVIDLATAAAAFGKIQDHFHRGIPIPADWAVDRNGLPTTEPARALEGSLNPMGGGKGYALGLGFEVLVGLLTSGLFGRDVLGTLDAEHICTKGDLFILIDPRVFPDFVKHASSAAIYLDIVRASRPVPDGPAVRVPGDRAGALRRERLERGIPLSPKVWQQARDILASLPPAPPSS